MEVLNLAMQGGAPLKQRTLNVLQNVSFEVLKTVLAHLGISNSGYYILEGCEVVGANITAGLMCINGDLCSFIGAAGTVDSKFTKVKYLDSVAYKNGQYMPMFEENKAVIGAVGTKLSDFDRIPKVQELVNQVTAWNDIVNKPAVIIDPANLTVTPPEKTVLERLDLVEKKLKIFTAGGVVFIWPLPVSQIPLGFQLVTNLQGKTLFGTDYRIDTVTGNPINPEFYQLGYSSGAKEHTLSLQEMPKHRHNNSVFANGSASGTNDGHPDNWIDPNRKSYTDFEGGMPDGSTKAFSLLNPYITVNFIEWVG